MSCSSLFRGIVVAMLLFPVLLSSGCGKSGKSSAQPDSPPSGAAEPASPDKGPMAPGTDGQANSSRPKVKPGVFQQIAVNSEPQWANRNGQVGWVQEVDPGDRTSVFSLKVRVGDEAIAEGISIVVNGQNGPISPLSGEDSFDIPTGKAARSVVQSPDYWMEDSGPIKVIILGARSHDTTPPLRVETVVAERTKRDVQTQGVNADWVAVKGASADIASLGRSLARLRISNFYCSGFAIAKGLLVTAYHCISASMDDGKDICAVTSIVFNYMDDGSNSGGTWASCVKVIQFDEALDYAVIAFALKDPMASVPALAIRKPDLSAHRDITLLHHPRGQVAQFSQCHGPLKLVDLAHPAPKAISDQREACGLDRAYLVPTTQQTANAVTYSCDTAPGSSGSPVIVDGAAVALHFTWDYRYYDSNAELSGSYEDVQCMVDQLPLGNWGTNICSILDDARSKAPGAGIPSCN